MKQAQTRPTLLLPGLAVLAGLLSLPVWAGWLDGGRGGLAAFLLSTTLLLGLSWRLTGLYGDDARWDIRTIDCATIALAVIVVLGLLLGTLGILYLPVLMLALAAITILLHTVGEGFIPSRTRRIQHTEHEPAWSLADVRWPHGVLAGLVMFGIGQLVRDRGLLPSVGDAIGYHLPFVAEWMQHGALVMPVPAAGDPSPPFYPLNSSGCLDDRSIRE